MYISGGLLFTLLVVKLSLSNVLLSTWLILLNNNSLNNYKVYEPYPEDCNYYITAILTTLAQVF